MAADWLRTEMEYRDMHDEGFPVATYGNELAHGGRVVLIGVDAGHDSARKVSASEAACMLGVSRACLTQMIAANQLEAFRDGHRTWVTMDSIERGYPKRTPLEGRVHASLLLCDIFRDKPHLETLQVRHELLEQSIV